MTCGSVSMCLENNYGLVNMCVHSSELANPELSTQPEGHFFQRSQSAADSDVRCTKLQLQVDELTAALGAVKEELVEHKAASIEATRLHQQEADR